ncbi:undecaprenyl-diphosphate phosphatase [Catenovulum sp. 2E275]|uniref:undecaprenyl-diphosphate phosphatase n=1 Tax=Catenovulum sp. 2E275 TaxID=2980497 RepID=UPI0021D0CDFE|nr:undecaprenyl-diphosphate phosphatase [Catenovulum sp. 2E275]MCU4674857.1 undecaprenyl-diphosphate phosphatase [Catenovulum sp. 2E275]
MSILEIVVLALLQGFTEFLPISSSAHLILPSQILGWQDQGLAFDVAVHIGSLAAVLIYFRKDVVEILSAWFKSLATKQQTENSQLAWWIIIATIPALVFGLIFKDIIEEYARSSLVIATTTIVFGLLLWWADAKAKQNLDMKMLGWKKALFIGFAQAIAMIPGTSRSGITITAGLMLGLNRVAAARFSFLMSIPIILIAGGYETLKLVSSNEIVDWSAIGLGTLLSFISAYTCIYFFLALIEKMGMLPFVIYRLILGAGLFYFVLA